LKKYLHFAKATLPTLSDEANEFIAAEYASLRAKAAEGNRTLPVTARQLETLIRIATAHAKARLSPIVEECDAQNAAELLQFALYHEVQSQDALGDGVTAAGTGNGGGGPGGGGGGGGAGSNSGPAAKRARFVADPRASEDAENLLPGSPESQLAGNSQPAAAAAAPVDRGALLASAVARAFQTAEEVPLGEVLPEVQAALTAYPGEPLLGEAEAELLLSGMEEQNLLMYAEGVLYRV